MSKPFHSTLETHFELMRSLRIKKKTWREIAEVLKHEHDLITSAQNCFQFFKRYSRRAAPLGFPDRMTKPSKDLAAPTRPAWFPKPESLPTEDLDFSVTNPADKFYTPNK